MSARPFNTFFLFSEYYLFYHLNSSFILCPKEDDSLFGDFPGMHLLIYLFIQHVSIDKNYISDTMKDIGTLKHKEYRPFLRHYMSKESCPGQLISRAPQVAFPSPHQTFLGVIVKNAPESEHPGTGPGICI